MPDRELEQLTARLATAIMRHYHLRADPRQRLRDMCSCGWVSPDTQTWEEHLAASLAGQKPWLERRVRG